MIATEVNLSHLHRLFEREWERTCQRRMGCALAPPYFAADLLRLVAECHTQPVEEWTSAVHTLVRDAGSVGNASVSPRHDVQLILIVLERVRQQAVQEHQWSDAPAPIPMFG